MRQLPRFKHDCTKCRYLGTTFSDGAHDWYVCGTSVVARYGDDGPEYWSNGTSMVDSDNYLYTDASRVDARLATPVISEKMIVARFMLEHKQ